MGDKPMEAGVKLSTIVLAGSLFLSGFAMAHKNEGNTTKEAQKVLNVARQMSAPFRSIIDSSYAYVVYPHVAKGGFIVGGAGGDGIVFKQGKIVGTSTLGQATFGLQIGGKTFSEIVAFENDRAFQDFEKGNLKLAAEMSGVAVTTGASLNAPYRNGIAIFTLLPKGLMAEISVGGQVLTFKPMDH